MSVFGAILAMQGASELGHAADGGHAQGGDPLTRAITQAQDQGIGQNMQGHLIDSQSSYLSSPNNAMGGPDLPSK